MENSLVLIVATLVLVAIPGPNAALIVANSLRSGLQAGLVTVFGTTLGVAAQLVLVVVGMATIIELAATALAWVKWVGVLYLLWLGIQTWRQPSENLVSIEAAPAIFWRGCLIAAVNPKTLMFSAAFLPQFVAAEASAGQVTAIAGVFLAVLLSGDLLWALFASSARPLLGRFSRLRNRLTGGFLVAAGVGLAVSRRY